MGSRLTVDITSSANEGANSTALGAHGGSGLSALGGVIRLHEIGPDAPPISHAIKLELFANQYYYGGGPQKRKLQPPSPSNGGRTQYVWPATGSDAYTWAACGLGSRCLAYHGTNEHLAPGSLLALPEAVASSLIPKLKTVPGARVAAAFRDYGGYIIDDTASDSASLSWESGADDVFQSTYNMTLNTAGGPWYDDLVAIFQGLHVVINNKPSSIGGGGEPRRPPLPPLCGTSASHKGDDDDSVPYISQVFQHSEGPCTCIGIPIVMRVQDTLLAFGQCRVGVGWAKDDGCYVKEPVPGDSSACNGTCIVLKRSVTAGRTWSNLSVVINGAFNMMPVFDSVRGKLVVSFDTGGAVDDKPFVQQPGATYATTASTVGPGILSAAAWSPPRRLFSFPGWASAPGPNVGVQLSGKAGVGTAGRLVFAGWANNTGRTCVVVIWYSDDGGQTFARGAELPGACEAGLQEMSDGRLLILANDGSARDKGPCPGDTLAHAFSTTGGASFSEWRCDPALINADSQAGLLVVNGTVVVSNPGVNPATCPPCSLNMRVHASSDGGEHFGLVQEFASGGKVWTGVGNNGTAGGYSSLTTLAGTTALGLAWETSGPGSTCVGSRCRVVFSAFNLPG